MAQIGIITEQGDLGFGFDALNEADNKVYEEATKNQQDNVQVINETKNNK